ncbi:expressed protein [Echinococcus multilocularis]|uniref:Expressed protein n=1 Tax=Echinococcus multilocularis TaxID=6211 RepID=A0A068Y1U9_ECHMU|nr:expressed protein [Echinococcus multilocularis]
MKQLLLSLAEMLYPKLTQRGKTCPAETSTESKSEEGGGRSAVEDVETDSFELLTMKQLLFSLAELLCPQITQCGKMYPAETSTESKSEEGSGRSAVEDVETDSFELLTMKQLLLSLAEMLYPKLTQRGKTCPAETSTESKSEEGGGRSAVEDVETDSFELLTMKQLLFSLAELLCPQITQCGKMYPAETSTESKSEEGSGRSAVEAVAEEGIEISTMVQLLLFLADMLYPQLSQWVKTCIAKTPCELKAEEASGTSVVQEAEVGGFETRAIRQILFLIAEMLYSQLTQCDKTCPSRNLCELKAEEVCGSSLLEEVEVEAGKIGKIRQILPFYTEMFYPKITNCVTTCVAKIPCVLKVRKFVGGNAVKEVVLEEYEVWKIQKVLLFFAKMLCPKLCQNVETCFCETPYVLKVKKFIGRMVKELNLQECEVQKMKKVLIFFADLLFPQLAHCLKACAAETPWALKVEIIGGNVVEEFEI